MMDPENCKGLLEMVLDIKIAHVDVSREKSIVYNPDYKGVRLDVYAEDENHTHYDIEMQVKDREIKKRSRYYHSQMDMELLGAGVAYENLPDSYVIFICDFDPFGAKKFRYTIGKYVEEAGMTPYDDGSRSIFLSTHGENYDEVPEELVKFLNFVRAPLKESTDDFGDEYVKKLQATIKKIKSDREMGVRYMTLEEMLKDEYKEGQIASIAAILNNRGFLTNDLRERIETIAASDSDKLTAMLLTAANASTLEQFEAELEKLQ